MVGKIFVIFALIAILALNSSKIGMIIFGLLVAVALIAFFGPIGLIFLLLVAAIFFFCANL